MTVLPSPVIFHLLASGAPGCSGRVDKISQLEILIQIQIQIKMKIQIQIQIHIQIQEPFYSTVTLLQLTAVVQLKIKWSREKNAIFDHR